MWGSGGVRRGQEGRPAISSPLDRTAQQTLTAAPRRWGSRPWRPRWPRRPRPPPAALTVFLLDHHGVADGQQAPELLHRPVPLAPHQGLQLLIVELEFAVGEQVPGIGVPLGDGGVQAAGSGLGHTPHPGLPTLLPRGGSTGLTFRSVPCSSSESGERTSFRIRLPPGGHTFGIPWLLPLLPGDTLYYYGARVLSSGVH